MLNKKNIKNYLVQKKVVRKNEKLGVEEIRGGTINRIFRVKTKNNVLVVKQFMDAPSIGENIILPPKRYYYERKAIEYLDQTLKEKITPTVLFFDNKNKVICMEDLGFNNRADNLMLAKKVKPGIFSKIGKSLAEMHNKSLYNKKIRDEFDNHEFHEISLHYRFYKYTQIKDPSLKNVKERLVEKTRKNNIAFVHHDLKINNIFIIKNRFYLIDYEGAHYSDPAMEIGYLLGHLFNYYFLDPSSRNKKIINKFWKSYIKNLDFKFKERLEHNVVKHTGFIIIYKLVGIAKQDFGFVDKKSKHRLIRIAKKIIRNNKIRRVNQIFGVS